MIDQMNAQLYRFCTTDGVLDGIISSNLYETVFENGSKFVYDFQNELIEIDNRNSVFSKRETISLSACTVDYLKKLGFKERTVNRHEMSYHRFSIPFGMKK